MINLLLMTGIMILVVLAAGASMRSDFNQGDKSEKDSPSEYDQ